MTIRDDEPMQLIKPCQAFQAGYLAYIEALGNEERYPFPLDFDHHDFTALLSKLDNYANGVNLPTGIVPSSTYWLVAGSTLLGVTNIRHHLNEAIAHCGGHIGLSVNPLRRGEGLGRYLMQLSIDELRARGVSDIHIHCYQDNLSSAAIIKANGGVLHSTLQEQGKHIQRYRIKQD